MDEQKKRQWVLVDVEKLPVRAEVQQAREKWEGEQVWLLVSGGKWRRGKVEHIYNSGIVRVVVYQKGSTGKPFAFEMRHIPTVLKLADQ